MKPAVFVISTGRCGTQWIAATFAQVYEDLATVTHEPIGPHYNPKKYLRAFDSMAQLSAEPEVARHIEWVERVLRTKTYIETGWPCFAAAPLFYRVFGSSLRLVHLVRHPIRVAASLTTHDFYDTATRNDDFTAMAQLDPFDHGVVQLGYRNKWDEMSQFEKCLYQWTEINLFANELKELYPDVPFYQVRMEDLMDHNTSKLRELAEFCGLPYRAALAHLLSTHVDNYQKRTEQGIHWQGFLDHLATLNLAEELGYRLPDVNGTELKKRYQVSVVSKLQSSVRTLRRKTKLKSVVKRIVRAALRSQGKELVDICDVEMLQSYEYCASHSIDILKIVILLRQRLGQECSFVQIGANDGVCDDGFCHLVKEHGLRGVLVEPQPKAFQKLVSNYEGHNNVAFENAAIWNEAGEVTLFSFDRTEEKQLQLDVFTSTNREYLEQKKQSLGLEANITTIRVPALTFADIITKHALESVTIVVIDTEGYDFEVVKQIDLQEHRPILIQFEHFNLPIEAKLECYHHLVKHGYTLNQTERDTCAILPAQFQL